MVAPSAASTGPNGQDDAPRPHFRADDGFSIRNAILAPVLIVIIAVTISWTHLRARETEVGSERGGDVFTIYLTDRNISTKPSSPSTLIGELRCSYYLAHYDWPSRYSHAVTLRELQGFSAFLRNRGPMANSVSTIQLEEFGRQHFARTRAGRNWLATGKRAVENFALPYFASLLIAMFAIARFTTFAPGPIGMRRLRLGMCPRCKYNLIGVPPGSCPECGVTWNVSELPRYHPPLAGTSE
jgi:hypothetical protein